MSEIIRVTSLDLPELQLYAGRRESDLKHACEPAPGYFIAESMKVIERALGAGYAPVSFLCAEKYAEELTKLLKTDVDVPVYTAEESVMEEIAGYHLTGCALALMRRKEPVSAEVLLTGKLIARDIRRIAVLEHVVNPTNLGAIVRSAAALGMDAVLFTPDCADPLYRRAIRVSMGTIFQIPWTFTGKEPAEWYENGVQQFKEFGFHTVAMALRDHSCRPDDPRFQEYEKLAVIVGTEGEGLADETIRQCNDTVMIPMTHGVDSLNVGAAAAVAFWNFGRMQD
ncbi:MAG: RNA methyltransferase [Eubacterium sp.]|nr:RNA methyltransferase [Eubacterium sp.]